MGSNRGHFNENKSLNDTLYMTKNALNALFNLYAKYA